MFKLRKVEMLSNETSVFREWKHPSLEFSKSSLIINRVIHNKANSSIFFSLMKYNTREMHFFVLFTVFIKVHILL